MPTHLTPPIQFTEDENATLLASVSASLQTIEQAGGTHGPAWTKMNALRTLFAENGYAFERMRDD